MTRKMQRQHEGEEAGLPVAQEAAEVVARLVEDEGGGAVRGRRRRHAGSSVSCEVDVLERRPPHVEVGQVEAALERPVGERARRATSGVSVAASRRVRRGRLGERRAAPAAGRPAPMPAGQREADRRGHPVAAAERVRRALGDDAAADDDGDAVGELLAPRPCSAS